MTIGSRQLVLCRRRIRDWGRYHPRTLAFLERIGCMRFDRGVMARGVAVGLFVALTPTLGVQTLLMLALCVLFRANFAVAFAVSWISNPFTLGPLYLGYYFLGELALSPLILSLSSLWNTDFAGTLLDALYFVSGSLMVALPAAAAGYGLSYLLARAFVRRPRSA